MAQCNFFGSQNPPQKTSTETTSATYQSIGHPLKLLAFPVKLVASHQNVGCFSQARNILASGLFWSWAGARLGKSPMGWTVGLIFFVWWMFFSGDFQGEPSCQSVSRKKAVEVHENLFSPIFGEDEPILTHIFQMG